MHVCVCVCVCICIYRMWQMKRQESVGVLSQSADGAKMPLLLRQQSLINAG